MKPAKKQKPPKFVSEAAASYNLTATPGKGAPDRMPGGSQARVGLRFSAETKQMVEQAAAVVGMTINAFVTAQAIERSRQILTETHGLALNTEARDHFLTLLDNAAEPNEALQGARRRYQEQGDVAGDRYVFKLRDRS